MRYAQGACGGGDRRRAGRHRVGVHDPDRESLTFLGGREEMLLGYPREQWMQSGFWMSLVHPEDRLAALTFVEAAQQSENFELLYR